MAPREAERQPIAVGGTYERFLFGYKGLPQPSDTADGAKEGARSGELARSFLIDAHGGPVKCLDAKAGMVVTGGADDLLRVLHLEEEEAPADMGCFVAPSGTPTAGALFSNGGGERPTHFLCGTSDGAVELLRAGPWSHLRVLSGHTSRVTGVAPHPSGALALTCSADRGFRLWDLRQGRCAYRSKLREAASGVDFLPSGRWHALLGRTLVSVTDAERGKEMASFRPAFKALCLSPWTDSTLATGGEGGSVDMWDCRSGSPALELQGMHDSRVKGMAFFGDSQEGGSGIFLATASSSGSVKVWDTRALASSHSCSPLAQADGAGRFTCLSVFRPASAGDPPPPPVRHQYQAPFVPWLSPPFID